MKKFFLALCAAAALFSLRAEDDDSVLMETVFADPTTYHSPTVANEITKFKNVKVFHSKRYPMLIVPVEDYDGKSEVSVTIRAARDGSQPAQIGIMCQINDRKIRKTFSSPMLVKNVSENFTDYHFKFAPGKLHPGTQNFRILIYTIRKRGNIYLESLKVVPVVK